MEGMSPDEFASILNYIKKNCKTIEECTHPDGYLYFTQEGNPIMHKEEKDDDCACNGDSGHRD
jgi:hypothetical protein